MAIAFTFPGQGSQAVGMGVELAAASAAARAVFETNYRIRCTDGSYRWTAVKGVPILAADGSVREWIGANTDIHDMVMAELALAQGLIVRAMGDAIAFCPALITTAAEMDELFARFDRAMAIFEETFA
jgi:malonyl CoA-acyl carrier protein transacylase